MKEQEKSLDPQLWHACAGSLVQIPAVNSTVFYFPQGHAEHAHAPPDFHLPRLQPLILCRVAAVNFLADSETDEVYAKITLLPLLGNDSSLEKDAILGSPEGKNVNSTSHEKPASFAKTLTQSDANNGGGFSVPRYCAETIFPRLDYTADPPVQTVIAKDIHGETWKFRHIYRGTPRRHLLTTGWSNFVNQKKLVAGDSIVFLRSETGDLCVGIRRVKRGGIGSGPGTENPFSGFSGFLRGGDDETKIMMMRRNNPSNHKGSGDLNSRARVEAMAEAVARAVSGQVFEVVYYPRASTPEFCVKAATVSTAMRIRWCSGMRFKMAFETEDSSRISWFMGTVSAVQVADPMRWPNSPWRVLQVAWDEPDLLQNVKRVNPWLVELVSNMPAMHLSPFSPRKKLRVADPFDFPLGGSKFPISPPSSGSNNSSNHPLCYLTGNNNNNNNNNNAPAVIQGARHAQLLGTNLLSGLHLNSYINNNNINKFHSPGLFSSGIKRFGYEHSRIFGSTVMGQSRSTENISCSLTVGNSDVNSEKTADKGKSHHFLLFGQPILTEQQVLARKRSLGEMNIEEKTEGVSLPDKYSRGFSWNYGEADLETGHCKVFMESEDVGRTIDLSVMGSYEELYQRLTEMFGIERSDLSTHVLYRDAIGNVKRIGDEPFSDFMKIAKRLTIMMDSKDDTVRKAWISAMRSGENGLNSSSKTGPLSIFA